MGLTGLRSSSQELPEQWDNVKKLAIAVRQQVAPLQANEVAALRQRCSAFDVEQQQFWERFRKEAPFRYGPPPPPRVSTASFLLNMAIFGFPRVFRLSSWIFWRLAGEDLFPVFPPT